MPEATRYAAWGADAEAPGDRPEEGEAPERPRPNPPARDVWRRSGDDPRKKGAGSEAETGAPGPGGEPPALPAPAPPPREAVLHQLTSFMKSLSELARRVDVTSQYLAAILEVWTMTPEAFDRKYPARVSADPVIRSAEPTTPAAGAMEKAGLALPNVDIGTLIKVLQALEGLRQLLSQLDLGRTVGTREEATRG